MSQITWIHPTSQNKSPGYSFPQIRVCSAMHRHNKNISTSTGSTIAPLWCSKRFSVLSANGATAPSEFRQQLQLCCANHGTYIMWHTSLSTTIYNTCPPYQMVYLSREKFPIIPFGRTAAAVLLPVASAPPPPPHPPVGSDGGWQVFAHHSHHSFVIIWVIKLEPRCQTLNLF